MRRPLVADELNHSPSYCSVAARKAGSRRQPRKAGDGFGGRRVDHGPHIPLTFQKRGGRKAVFDVGRRGLGTATAG